MRVPNYENWLWRTVEFTNTLDIQWIFNLAFDEGLVGNVISDEENGRGGLICLALKG